MRNIFFVIVTVAGSMPGLAQTKAVSPETGVCSYYARRYDGRITAGGKRFNSNALTAAHRTYPMGTKLKLTNVSNDKSVEVVVNDRGPFVKGRDISVTRRAARQLGFVKQGFTTVRIEQIH
jgi:rare lipoprotein A